MSTPSRSEDQLRRPSAYLFYFCIFLGSTLLFALQPLMAKSILPWFGGGAGIWNLCQLFFQVGLLLGYFYAHGLGHRQFLRWLHPLLLLACALFLPVVPNPAWKAGAALSPELSILGLLAATVGLPYALLCSSSPLMADLYRRNFPKSDPYLLFAWSNFGSLLGLLSYPFLIEPGIGLSAQAKCWSAAFVLYGLLASALVVLTPPESPTEEKGNTEAGAHPPEKTSPWPHLSWVLLPALSSLILTAGTHHISSELAPIPLLWCVPLSLYLISYIVVSANIKVYRRQPFGLLLALSVLVFNRAFMVFVSPVSQLVQTWTLLMVYFTVIHGELWEHRPAANRLTAFYLWMATGGALGTFVASILAPWLLVNGQELALSVLALPIAWVVVSYRFLEGNFKNIAAVGALAVTSVSAYQVWSTFQDLNAHAVLTRRNFYGRCIVNDSPQVQLLFNGVTCHGIQFHDPDKSRQATSYFSWQGGVGRSFMYLRKARPQGSSVGVVGLGIGILASYTQPNDTMKFYEIDPKVIDIANQPFLYLRQALGKVQIVQGDARLELEKNQDTYDMLVVDAFSGDAIPTHLLDNEVMAIYRKHLKPEGIIAFHISNRYLSLSKVVSTLANNNGMVPLLYQDEGDLKNYIFPSIWVVAVDPKAPAQVTGYATQVEAFQALGFRIINTRSTLWTDDYTSLFEVLNM